MCIYYLRRRKHARTLTHASKHTRTHACIAKGTNDDDDDDDYEEEEEEEEEEEQERYCLSKSTCR